MTANKVQRLIFWTAWVIAALLLGRFAVDFIREMPVWLAAPFVLLVAAALLIAAMNIVAAGRPLDMAGESPRSRRIVNVLLLISIPLAYLAASLDCTGLSLQGCTPFCTFIKTVWIPALALGCVTLMKQRSQGLLGAILLMSLVPLWPHCLCFNVGNGWWIDRIHASPTCYAWGFTTSLIALSALRAGKREWLSLLVNGAIIGGATAFFVGHHYFHFPW